METQTKSVLKNYYAPTPQKFRKVGDSILFFCVGVTPIIASMPASETAKLWIVVGVSVLGVIGKTITNFFTETPPTEQPLP